MIQIVSTDVLFFGFHFDIPASVNSVFLDG